MLAVVLRIGGVGMVTTVLLPVVAMSLRFVGLRSTMHLLRRRGANHDVATPARTAECARTLARLVAATARHHPFNATCLTQSVTLWYLLRRRGIQSEVRVGVSTAAGAFTAHSWVDFDQQVLLDEPDVVTRFAVIM